MAPGSGVSMRQGYFGSRTDASPKRFLGRWNVAPEGRDRVLLVVSELVTSAVEHAEPPIALHLNRKPVGE